MSPKTLGIVTTAALAGAGALCARHMKSAKACPCNRGTADDDRRRESPCSPQEVRDAA